MCQFDSKWAYWVSEFLKENRLYHRIFRLLNLGASGVDILWTITSPTST